MKKEWIILLTGITAGTLSSCQEKKVGKDHQLPERPNILWITCEDMSPRLGFYGDEVARTPNIDQLAARGIRYTNVYSVSGVCAPSRAALISGMYPTSFGAQHMRTTSRTASLDQITDPELLAIPVYEAVLPVGALSYPEHFRMAGYFTTNNSKTDYQYLPTLTEWDENGSHAHWRNRKDKDQPFFSVFNIMETHESRVWRHANKPILVNPDDIELPPYYPDSEIIRRDMAIHYSNIIRMDSIVGTIIQQLEEDGLVDNTIIFYYSDHGDGLPRMKRWNKDSGLHVPLIVSYPDGKDAGTVNDQMISFVDFAPTALSLAGLDVPENMHGVPFLGDDEAEPREYIFASRDRMDPALDCIRTVRDKRYKYHRNHLPHRPYIQFLPYRDQMPLMQELFRFRDNNQLNDTQMLIFAPTKPTEELYDLENDPHEINNLADDPDYADIKKRLSEELDKWLELTNDPLTLPETELVKQLWPPDGVQPQTLSANLTEKDGFFHLKSATAGALIAYQKNEDMGSDHWQLYINPLDTNAVDSITAIAVRKGYKPSREDRLYWPETQNKQVYKKVDATELKLHFYYPEEANINDPLPAIIFFHGGGWVSGRITQFEPHARHFASKGMVAILAEYRIRSRYGTTPFDAVADAKSAIRFLRENADELGIDPDQIVGSGGSAGGHIAAAAAMVPGLDDPADNHAVSAVPNALVLFNPVYDNGPKGYGYERIGDRYPEISPMHNIKPGNPPTVVFLGTNDRLIPVATAKEYRDKMEKAGNVCELFLYEGKGHGFFNYHHTESYQETLAEAERFLISLGYIESE